MEIKVYDDLIKYQSEIVAWSSVKSFDVEKLSLHDKELLKNINVIEVIFPGNQGKREDQSVFNFYELFVKKFLTIIKTNKYIIKIEPKAQRKNRIRSHRGVIPRSIDRQNFIEEEVGIGNEETVIVGMVKIKEDNYEYLFDDFYGSTCFVIISQEEIFNTEYLISLVNDYIILDKITLVDYVSLLLNGIKNDNVILRSAGDGGDVEVDLQIFAKSQLLGGLINNVKCALTYL